MVCSRYGIWFGHRPIGHPGETVFLISFPKFLLINVPLKPSRVLNEDTDFYFSRKLPTLPHLNSPFVKSLQAAIFLLPANSLLNRNFLMVILVHMYLE